MAYLIAITDDDYMNSRTARRILEKNGYETICFKSGIELLNYIEKKKEQPDLILLDIHMEQLNGIQTMIRLRKLERGKDIPVIFLTADVSGETKTEAFACGAMDYIEKPFIPSLLLLRVRNTIDLFRLQNDLKAEVNRKTQEVIKEHERNERLSLEVVRALAETIDAKDKYTRGHSARVAKYAREIARRAGYTTRQLNDIYMMGLLHDIGKIGVGGSIINKPTGLTDEEYDIMKTHPNIGYEILKNISEMPKLSLGAKYHHERYDGKGYPEGLKGEEIPEEARIIAVADAYDAMASKRSYHKVKDQLFVRKELNKGKGTQFDPRFADIMIQMIDEDTAYTLQEHDEKEIIQTEPLREAPKKQPHNNEDIPEQEKQEPEKIDLKKKNDNRLSALDMLKDEEFNTKPALDGCMGDIDIYIELLNDFVDIYNDSRTHFSNAIDFRYLELKDRDYYHRYVHTLKSNSKMIGAMRLSKIAANQEFYTSDANYNSRRDDKIIAGHNEMTESLDHVLKAIKKFLRENDN